MVTGAAAAVGIAGFLIAMARLCFSCAPAEPMDYVALIMVIGGFPVFAIGAIGLLLIGIDTLARAIQTRVRERRAA